MVEILPVVYANCQECFVWDDFTSTPGFTPGSIVGVEVFVALISDVSGRFQNGNAS